MSTYDGTEYKAKVIAQIDRVLPQIEAAAKAGNQSAQQSLGIVADLRGRDAEWYGRFANGCDDPSKNWIVRGEYTASDLIRRALKNNLPS